MLFTGRGSCTDTFIKQTRYTFSPQIVFNIDRKNKIHKENSYNQNLKKFWQLVCFKQNIISFLRFHTNLLYLRSSSHIFLLVNLKIHVLSITKCSTYMCLLWNHFYSWGSMLMGSQNFPDSWGRNFVGSVIENFLINVKQMIGYRFVGM